MINHLNRSNTCQSCLVLSLVLYFGIGAIGHSESLQKVDPKYDASIEKKTLKGGIQKSHSPNPLQSSLLHKINKQPLTDSLSNEMLQNSASRSIGVIGVLFQLRKGNLPIIKYVFPNTPASKAGLQVGDYIVAVDGTPTIDLEREEIYGSIIGTPNTPVNISLKRADSFFVKKLMRIDVTDIPDYATRSKYLREL